MSKVIPQIHTANVGDTVVFKCESDKSVDWTFNKGSLPNNAKITMHRLGTMESTLTIQNIRMNNCGLYICSGEGSNYERFSSKGMLVVRGKK